MRESLLEEGWGIWLHLSWVHHVRRERLCWPDRACLYCRVSFLSDCQEGRSLARRRRIPETKSGKVGFRSSSLPPFTMDAVELEKYEYQLAQIKLALVKDPTNVEYLNLAEELASLISLTREYLASTAPPAAAARASGSSAGTTGLRPPRAGPSGTPTHVFKAGDDCLARYSADQKFYPARITSIGGAAENLVFSVIFQGYDSTELVQRADVKALSESSKKRQMVMVVEDDAEKDKKRKKNEKKAETRAEQTAAQGSKQKSWQSFAKKVKCLSCFDRD